MRRGRGIRFFHLDRFGRRMGESVEEEVRFHLDTRIEALIREGRSPEQAREEALAGFGDPDLVVERCRRIDERGARRRAWTDLLTDTLRDTKVALRALRKAKGYAAVTALSLAVGIGVSACLFTAVHAVWVAPVPGVTNQERIVDPVIVDGGFELWGWTYPDFLAVREAETPFEAWAAWNEADATIGLEGEVSGAERIHVAYASAEYFQVLGAQPVMGRGFLPSEDAGAGQDPVAVVGHEFWQTRLGGRPDILGQSITLNRVPFTVVGVAPEGFRGARVTLATIDLWMPLSRNPALLGPSPFTEDHERFSVQALGRLRPGATLSQAQAALGTVFARLAAERPETHQDRAVRAASFGRFPAQNRMGDLVAVAGLWGLVGVLLLIICGNLAGMTLARSASREKEIGVRLALGSSRPALVRALMVEAFLLALVGGGAGTALAMVGMATLSPADLGVQAPGVTFEPSGWVLALSFALALLAALTFGLVPALRFTRPELVSALKDETGGGGRRVGRIQRFATSAQAGVALSLLVVGALFLRSLSRTDERALGFQPAGLVVTDYRTSSLSSGLLDLSAEGYPSLDQGGGALLDGLIGATSSLAGVAAVALADGVPLDRRWSFGQVAVAEGPDEPEGRVRVEFTRITEGYFPAIGAPLLSGRGFRPSDDAASEAVAIITRSLAERLWPGAEALGRQLRWSAGTEDPQPRTVVGVVGDVAASRPGQAWPHVFIPLRQDYSPHLMMVVRSSADMSALVDPLRQAIRSVDPGLPLARFLSGRTVVARATQEQRATGQLGGGLGLLILILSALGVHGTVALAVTQRTREIGLRMALGASREKIVLRVLGDAIRLSVPGMVVGALVAGGTAAAMRSMLLGLSPLDPVSFLAVGALLLLVVLLAALTPALRASGIQPLRALKAE